MYCYGKIITYWGKCIKAEFYFKCDMNYFYEIHYMALGSEYLLAIAFIPEDECSEVKINSFVGMASDAIEISFEYGSKVLAFNQAENYETISKLFKYKQLHFMFILLFPSREKMLEYVARLTSESIF